MHSHIYIQSNKNDVSYCKICNQLSYKESIFQSIPIRTYNIFNIAPLKLKYKPFSIISNYKLPNHIKYLEYKNKGISKIKFLTYNFGLKSMILYKSINFMNQIFLENEISIDNIDNIASLCVLLVTKYNDCCIPSIIEEYLNKNENDILYNYHLKKNSNLYINNKIDKLISIQNIEHGFKHKTNINGLICYIKKNVNNFKYWEVLCLKYLNYNLGKLSAYDYLILFFSLGIFFCKEKIDIIDKLKYCINILDLIINDKKSCDFSQYTFAMSIIKVALERDNFFDKKIFKYIYGVDLSKKKYINCSNLIKNILNISVNIDNSKNSFNILNTLLNFNQLNTQKMPRIYNNLYINYFPLNNNIYINNNIILLNENGNEANKFTNKNKNNDIPNKNTNNKDDNKINNIIRKNESDFVHIKPSIKNIYNHMVINNNIINNNFELKRNFLNNCNNNNLLGNYYFYNNNNFSNNSSNYYQ